MLQGKGSFSISVPHPHPAGREEQASWEEARAKASLLPPRGVGLDMISFRLFR